MKQSLLALIVTGTVFSPLALSHQTGDLILRAGATTVAPDENASTIVAGNTDLGVSLTIDSSTQLGLNIAYFLTDNVNIELLAATPFSHDVNFSVADPLGTGNKLGKVKHLPPTLTVNYYLNDAGAAFQPYIGAGLNYTIIFDESFTSANKAAGLSDLSLANSTGLAAQIGMDYMLSNEWHINASVRWLDIDTDASFSVGGATGRVASIEIDPWVYTVSVGYSF